MSAARPVSGPIRFTGAPWFDSWAADGVEALREGQEMFRKLVKITKIEIDGTAYEVRFFELRTIRGARRFSCEVRLGAADLIIVDDDSMTSLESKMDMLAPATVYSRLLAARPSVAA
jgi:hypothetical protein